MSGVCVKCFKVSYIRRVFLLCLDGPGAAGSNVALPLPTNPVLGLLIAMFLLVLGSMVQATAAESAPDEGATVERGHYLVQAANCISCHTAKDGQPFAGGNAFDTPIYRFIGKLYSSNITPDPETGIGAWTEDDFIKAMRHGVAPGGKYLFPIFPYTAFTKLTTADIKSIYAYLRTVAPVHAAPPEPGFFFRQRWAMALWNALFFKEGEATPDSTQPADWNRGYYLVEALGHCSACHTDRNIFLAENAHTRFSGGLEIGEVEAGKYRTWAAPNLTSAKSGLSRWSADELKKYLKTGANRWAGTLGPMNEVIANSLQYLSDDDIAAMAVYIKSFAADGESSQQTLSADENAAGQALYEKYCDECHLSSGRGGFRKAPPVAGSTIVQARDPASIINVILYGATPAADIPVSFNAWESMPGFKDKMTDVEAAELANYLRATWGNFGGRVSPGAVAAQR